MNVMELVKICDDTTKRGLKRIMLTMPMPKHGLRGYKVKTPFGLGEIANSHEGQVVFFIEIKKVIKWIEKTLKKIEEAKKHETIQS